MTLMDLGRFSSDTELEEGQRGGIVMSRVVSDAEACGTDFLVYSTTFCPYCVAVKRLLTSKGLSFHEINFDHEPGIRSEVVGETGHRTVPVVIDNRGEQPMFIGGFDETNRFLSK